ILIGASSADIRSRLTATLQSTLDLPCVLDIESTMREWMADRRGRQVLGNLYEQIENQVRRLFAGEDRYGNAHAEEQVAEQTVMGMDIMDMMIDMPVVSVLMFQQSSLTMPAEEMVAGLLRQVHSMK
ncbi:MAG TPA: hypothetical protein PK078_03550, partial [Anaerolineales bacterium]|nr:hypothetical protein [Anaerolineales bacterium]